MRAKELLTELFNNPVPINWDGKTKFNPDAPSVIWANASIEDIVYRFMFSEDRSTDTDNIWEFAFEAEYTKPMAGTKTGVRQRSFKLTKSGHEFQLFATVIQVLKEFILKIKPNVISWTADKTEESRVSLYSTMLKKLKPEIAKLGYTINGQGQDGAYSTFSIQKI